MVISKMKMKNPPAVPLWATRGLWRTLFETVRYTNSTKLCYGNICGRMEENILKSLSLYLTFPTQWKNY